MVLHVYLVPFLHVPIQHSGLAIALPATVTRTEVVICWKCPTPRERRRSRLRVA